MNKNEKPTLIFDYDGTINETLRIFEPAMRSAIDYLKIVHGEDIPYVQTETLERCLGLNAPDTWKLIAGSGPEQHTFKAIKRCGRKMVDAVKAGEGRWYDGVIEMLDKFKSEGYRMLVLSNCLVRYRKANWESFEMEKWFEGFYDCESFDNIPKEDIIAILMKEKPGDYIMIGDRIGDLKGARGNNIPFIGCTYGYGAEGELADADALAHSPHEIHGLVEKIVQNEFYPVKDLTEMATFGVAGNFTGHLEQAGEAADFVNVKTAEENAPKAMFPTYIPKIAGGTPSYLGVFPFDDHNISFPIGEEKLQIEPECAIVFDLEWEGTVVKSMKPVCFGAANDCSIRKQGAQKISEKKNWGMASKGFSSQRIKLNEFTKGCELDKYRIASFLVRNSKAYAYGEDSPVSGYSYIYEKLIAWMIDRLNNQKNLGPAENINAYLNKADRPDQIMVSIGATRYTDFGVVNFLREDDLSVVVVYSGEKYSPEEIAEMVKNNVTKAPDASFLVQKVIFE